MKKIESHKHFIIGENRQWFPEEDFVIHMADPRCFIRYSAALAMFSDYDEFYDSIAKVQWLDGRPSDTLIEKTLTDAWNFLCIEDQLLEEDFSDELPPEFI